MSTSRHSAGSATWVAWLPLLFVGAMLFWTIALGLGGLSLVTVTALSAGGDSPQVYVPMPPTATEPMPGNAASGCPTASWCGCRSRLSRKTRVDNAGAVSPSLDVIEAGP